MYVCVYVCEILWHSDGKRGIWTILHNGSDETRVRNYVSQWVSHIKSEKAREKVWTEKNTIDWQAIT
jgi:hypothetical protein